MKNLTRNLVALFLCFTLVRIATTQQVDDKPASADDIAKELANPNAALGSFAFQLDYIQYQGTLTDADDQYAFKFNAQPALPYPLGNSVNLFVRPLIPVNIRQPVYTGTDWQNIGFNLGDISFDAAVGKTWPSKWLGIVGVFGSAPTATDDALSSDQWTLGPELLIGRLFDWGFLGILVNHAWSLSSNNGDVSITGGQYFYTILLKDGWSITAQPSWSYNHNAANDEDRLTLPLGIGVTKAVIAGKIPIKFALQYWYYIASPETFGSQHQVRFQIAPVIPLPW